MDYIQWLKRLDIKGPSHTIFSIEEIYLWDRVKEIVQRDLLNNQYLPFNYEELKADEITPALLKEKLETLPLFVDKRFIIIEKAPLKKEGATDPILAVLSDFMKTKADHVCIFLSFLGSKPFRGKLFKSMELEFERVELERLSNRQVQAFVKKKLAKKNLDISPSALEMIVAASEYNIKDSDRNLYDLENLTDRISDLKKIGRLEAWDVEEALTAPSERNIYAFTDKIVERKIKEAFILLEGYYSQGQDEYRLFYSLARQVRNLISAKVLSASKSQSRNPAKLLNLPDFVYRKLLKGSNNYKLEELLQVQDMIFAIEKKMKTESFNMKQELERLVISI